MIFADRVDAGRRLAGRLEHLRGAPIVVLGLPRGGVVVAAEVAALLRRPLGVLVVRKLGVPSQPELAMGAIGEDGVVVWDEAILRAVDLPVDVLDAVLDRERAELARRVRALCGGRSPVELAGRTAVVVDDGVATGSTARAACRVARSRGATRVVLAVPVAPQGWQEHIGAEADELVSVATPQRFTSIGTFYGDFTQASDAEVLARLERAGPVPDGAPTSDGRGPTVDRDAPATSCGRTPPLGWIPAGEVQAVTAAGARAAEELGWSVVPLHAIRAGLCTCARSGCPSPGKHPRIAWAGSMLQPATSDQLDRWWRRWPASNVGIVTGPVSQLVVLTVDPRRGGAETLAALVALNGDLPLTPRVLTGDGGWHFYFAHPGGFVPTRTIGPGLGVHGDGGLVVAPPSKHNSVSGRRYHWVPQHAPADCSPSALPVWLALVLAGDVAQRRNEKDERAPRPDRRDTATP